MRRAPQEYGHETAQARIVAARRAPTALSTHEEAPIVRSQPQGWRPEQLVGEVRRNDLRMLTPTRKPNVKWTESTSKFPSA